MPHTIDYYLAASSPWTYLGHERLNTMAKEASAVVRVKPVDLVAQVFPVSGGLPLPQRAPQRQAYRLLDLKRFGEALNIPIHIEPKFFPVDATRASLLIVATQMQAGDASAMALAGAVLAAVWAQERNIADLGELTALLRSCGLPQALLAESLAPEVQASYQRFTQEALACGVFGAPSYVVDAELFWGQDRLDFVQRRLARG